MQLFGFVSVYSDGFIFSCFCDKLDDFVLIIVNFLYLDDNGTRRPSYAVYISLLIRFARLCIYVDDFIMLLLNV